jgi:putative transposase
MGRPHRAAAGGYVYHVLNRANARMRIFEEEDDCRASSGHGAIRAGIE